ncbi:hypothetical protein EDD17DRAFT_1654871 [Pisolithus thermaeus]|nr:hypothetical protein EV401DRAFT_726084 [Pisolithus croceorrhizus]KAI6144872.1 hypothetical protein EDD17DRAFT_1654871 [Pisolithus thermaeus]
MDPQSAGSPVHARVFNHRYYALFNALESQPTRPKVDPNVVHPTYLVGDNSSLRCYPGFVDQPYLFDVAPEYTLVPTRTGLVYPPTHPTNTGHLECSYEYSNCQIQHHPITSCATSGIIGTVTGLAKDGTQTSRENPSAASQKKSRVNGYDGCVLKECLYLGPNGTRCSQVITCATVPEHFISHGVANKSRDEVISCQWEGCSHRVMRHNFVRHVREKHLGHVRGSATHSSKKEREYGAFSTGSIEVEVSRQSGHV